RILVGRGGDGGSPLPPPRPDRCHPGAALLRMRSADAAGGEASGRPREAGVEAFLSHRRPLLAVRGGAGRGPPPSDKLPVEAPGAAHGAPFSNPPDVLREIHVRN